MIKLQHKIFGNYEELIFPKYYECDKWWYSNPEPQTINFVIDILNKNSTVIDAGAQIGLYSILFSKICQEGVVYSFEPTDTYDFLLENLQHNNCKNVFPNKKALSNKVGIFEEKIYKIWSQQTIENKEFEFETIDNFVETNNLKIDLLKIDVDSYDYEVLLGSEKTIKNQSPIIVVELNYALHKRGYTEKDAIDFLEKNNYYVNRILDEHNYIFYKKN